MMWTLDSAIDIIRIIQPICRRDYYNCCLYGSVLYRGFSDNDLDLQIVPIIDIDRPNIIIDNIKYILPVKEVSDPYFGLLDTYSVIMKLIDGRVLDVIIRLNNHEK